MLAEAADEDGLEFYDPIAAQRQAKIEAQREREIEQPKMITLNGKLVHAASIAQNNAQNVKQRQAMLQDLKAKSMAKSQRVADLQQIRSTFQTTDLG